MQTRKYLVIAGGVVFAALALGAGYETTRSQIEHPSPPAHIRTVAPQTPRAHGVDLTASPGGVPVPIPAGAPFDVTLLNAAPKAQYRVTWMTPPGPARPRPVRLPFLGPFEGYRPSPNCATARDEAAALLATADEQEAAQRLAALDGHLSGPCGAGFDGSMLRLAMSAARLALREIRTLEPSEQAELRIERLDEATGQARKTWTVVFRGEVTSAAAATQGTEESWIVAEVARHLATLARFAAGAGPQAVRVQASPGPAANAFHVVVEAGGQPIHEGTVAATPHIWSPAAYEPVAAKLLRSTRGSKPGPAGTMADALTDLRATVLEAKAREVATALEGNPRDVRLYEDAALVTGAYALREMAGPFSDVRPALSRMTALLAVARGLSGPAPPGESGRLAAAIIETLASRQRSALETIEELDRAPQPSRQRAAWVRALRMRVTGDWRPGARKTATLIERLEHFRAQAAALSSLHALGALGTPPERVPDWARIVFQYMQVESGHWAVASGLPLELSELSELAGLKSPALAAVVALANERWAPLVAPDTARLRPTILGRGAWAESAQRHVSNALLANVRFSRNMLGDQARTDRAVQISFEHLSALRLFPLVALQIGRDGPAACPAVRELVSDPPTVPASLWLQALQTCGPYQRDLPDPRAWFRPSVPAGTAYEFGLRVGLGPLAAADPAEAARVRDLAPYDPWIATWEAEARLKRKATAAEARQAAGPVADYHVGTLRRIAQRAAPGSPEHLGLLDEMCRLSADECGTLGDALVAAAAPEDKAAAAFERFAAEAYDGIGVSNNVGWLVDHHLRRGNKTRALELATRAAQAYSFRGLETMAQLQEKLGNVEEAESYFKKAAERYDTGKGPLDSFYLRQNLKHQRYKDEAAAVIKAVFPRGLERVSLQDFAGPPVDGLRVTAGGEAVTRAGLAVGSIIVALDGYRVRTDAQYEAVRDMSDDRRLILIAWHQNRYVEATAESPNSMRRLGLQFQEVSPSRMLPPGTTVDGEALARWLAALKDPSVRELEPVYRALGAMGPNAAVPLVGLLLQPPDRDIGMRAQTALLNFMPASALAPTASRIEAAASAESSDHRALAARLLGRVGSLHPTTVATLTRLLRDPAQGVRVTAAGSLGDVGPAARAAVPALQEMAAEDPDDNARLAAAAALKRIQIRP